MFPLSRDKVVTFLNGFPYGVVFSDKSGKILFVNDETENIFGYSKNEVVGKPVEVVLPAELNQKLGDGGDEFDYDNPSIVSKRRIESKCPHKDGSLVPIEFSYHLIKDDGNQFNLSIIRNMSQQIELQERLYQETITDSLTGLFNRRYFDNRIIQECHRASRYQRLFSIIILDIDGFKQANDLFGHSFGDEMLVKATKIFREVLRDGDTACRYGGDEFALILPETTKEGAVELAERLRSVFANNCNIKEKRISLTLSIGVASHPEDGSNEVDLVRVADRRMYQSKESGGNIITAYNIKDADESDDAFILLLTRLIHLVEKNRGWHSQEGVSHSQEIRALGVEIGRKLCLPEERLRLYEHAAMLHDIGTIHIPRSLFDKKGKLTEQEIKEIRKHTEVGEEILGLMDTTHNPDIAELKTIVSQHHEWVDGNGYPRGLKGEEILPEAKILAVTDAYSAMRTSRAYRPALTSKEVVNELKQMSGKQFDSEVVNILLELLDLDTDK